uniref:Uncharacterized protein n=1 Tax=Rhizobium rhizogenes TaxID=359 RepID=A0A7S5DR90_RHIRH|nr:hypothetical protein pC5.7d_678 [Rhizobium rhizogenes]
MRRRALRRFQVPKISIQPRMRWIDRIYASGRARVSAVSRPTQRNRKV